MFRGKEWCGAVPCHFLLFTKVEDEAQKVQKAGVFVCTLRSHTAPVRGDHYLTTSKREFHPLVVVSPLNRKTSQNMFIAK